MTYEDTVNNIISKRNFGKSPLHFRHPFLRDYFDYETYRIRVAQFEKDINELKAFDTIEDRLFKIIIIIKATYDSYRKMQCKGGSRRSAGDLWRIYKYYFPDDNVDLFTIMRTLYTLVKDNKYNVNTNRCPDIKKRVFWPHNDNYSWANTKLFDEEAELGVSFSNWKEIGANNG